VKERLRHLTILNHTSADTKISELQQQQNLLANMEAELDKMDAGIVRVQKMEKRTTPGTQARRKQFSREMSLWVQGWSY
jgi:hypothetical protein